MIHTVHSPLLTWLMATGMFSLGMGKLVNNVLGDLKGRAGTIVGGKWKDGVHWIRARVRPTQRGTLKELQKYEAHLTSSFSYKQMNIRRAVLQVLGYIGRSNLQSWIDIVWGDYNTRHPNHKHPVTNMNLFVKQNAGRLLASMPNKAAKYNAASNAPDLTQMLVSYGDLEATSAISSAAYTTGTGALVISFASAAYTNGLPTDLAYAMVAKKPILEAGTYKATLFIYPPSRGDNKTRTDGEITLTLPTGLTASDLIAYVFFKDAAGTLGFSNSVARQVA